MGYILQKRSSSSVLPVRPHFLVPLNALILVFLTSRQFLLVSSWLWAGKRKCCRRAGEFAMNGRFIEYKVLVGGIHIRYYLLFYSKSSHEGGGSIYPPC